MYGALAECRIGPITENKSAITEDATMCNTSRLCHDVYVQFLQPVDQLSDTALAGTGQSLQIRTSSRGHSIGVCHTPICP